MSFPFSNPCKVPPDEFDWWERGSWIDRVSNSAVFFSCRGRDGWDAPESDMWLVNRRLTSHNRTKAESATNRAPPTHQPVEEQYGGYGH